DLASAVLNRTEAAPTPTGSLAARPSTDSTDFPKSALSARANRPLSGPSASLASAAMRRAASCTLMCRLLPLVCRGPAWADGRSWFRPGRWPVMAWLGAGRSSAARAGRSGPFEDRGNALAATDAHRDQRVPAVDPAQLVQRLDRQDRAGRADRVAERNTAAVRVG